MQVEELMKSLEKAKQQAESELSKMKPAAEKFKKQMEQTEKQMQPKESFICNLGGQKVEVVLTQSGDLRIIGNGSKIYSKLKKKWLRWLI